MKQKLRNYISEGKIKLAIEELLSLTRLLKDEDLVNETLIQSAKLKKLNKDNRIGFNSDEQSNLVFSKITHALLEIIGKLPEKIAENNFSPTISENKAIPL